MLFLNIIKKPDHTRWTVNLQSASASAIVSPIAVPAVVVAAEQAQTGIVE